jgi:DNA-directed RNA polymerase subunit RPC12/RpoP
MFNPFNIKSEFMVIIVAAVISISFALYLFLAFRGKDDQSLRCPGCGFLVDIKDVQKYGYVCPDCKTNWRVHPLKNDDDEEVNVAREETEESEAPQSSRGRNKRLVR